MAISGVMTALATAVLLLGGVIPAATFVGPALAGALLVPVFAESGQRMALGACSISPLVQFNLWIVDLGLRSWARCCLYPPYQMSGCLAGQSFQIPSESKASCLRRFQPW